MEDHSDFLSQGQVESSVQSTDQQQPDRHELPSLNHQSSIFSLTFDDFNCTFSDGTMSLGSMNMEEILNSIWTAEGIQACAETPVTNSSTALNTVSTKAATTIGINPQVPEGEINTSIRNEINIHQSLRRQGSVMLPASLSQKTVDEVWSEIHKFQQEPEHVSTGSTVNVQKVVSAQRQTTFGEMTLEDFLIEVGVIPGNGHPPSVLLKQACESYQNNNNTALGSRPPGQVARPVIAIEGAGNAPAYLSPPQSSVRHAASVASGRIPNRYQGEVRYEVARQNGASGGGYGQGQGKRSPPVSSFSLDSEDAHQQNGVNQTGMNTDEARKQNALVDRVVSRRQKRLIKNRESAARSRARKQAFTLKLEAELKGLKEENARLRQAVYIGEKMKAQKAKDKKKGMRRSWSWQY